MRIVYLRPQKSGRMLIGVEGEEGPRPLSISLGLYDTLGHPTAGCELDGEALGMILREDEEYRAMKKALYLLSFSDKSVRALITRLRQAGFSADSSRSAAEECVRLGYVNEDGQLRRLVMQEAAKLRGPRLILSKLGAKGYSASAIRRVIDELVSEGELDFKESLARLYAEENAETDEDRRALRYKHGY